MVAPISVACGTYAFRGRNFVLFIRWRPVDDLVNDGGVCLHRTRKRLRQARRHRSCQESKPVIRMPQHQVGFLSTCCYNNNLHRHVAPKQAPPMRRCLISSMIRCRTVRVWGGAGAAEVRWVERIHRQLHSGQERLLWQSVQRVLEAEAAEADAGGHGHALAAQLTGVALRSGCASTTALGPLLLSLYLKSADGEHSQAPPSGALKALGFFRIAQVAIRCHIARVSFYVIRCP